MRPDESNHEPRPPQCASLFTRVKSGDPEAWDELFELHKALIHSWAQQAGVNQHAAEDIVQEVFIELYRHVARSHDNLPEPNLHGWLKTATKHKVADHFRAKETEPASPGGSWMQELLASIPDPGRAADCANGNSPFGDHIGLDVEALHRTRAQSEDTTWWAFVRLVGHGQPAREVAEELGMTVSAVYQAKYRVMERIKIAAEEIRRERDGLDD